MKKLTHNENVVPCAYCGGAPDVLATLKDDLVTEIQVVCECGAASIHCMDGGTNKDEAVRFMVRFWNEVNKR